MFYVKYMFSMYLISTNQKQNHWEDNYVKFIHCDFKVASSKKIDENFGNNFFKTKANNKCLSDKMYMYRAKEKHKKFRAVKSKPKALRHLKIDETFYKQTESMC